MKRNIIFTKLFNEMYVLSELSKIWLKAIFITLYNSQVLNVAMNSVLFSNE